MTNKTNDVLGSLSALSQLESAAADGQNSQSTSTAQTSRQQSQAKKIERLKARRDVLLKQLQQKTVELGDVSSSNTTHTDSDNENPELTSALNYLQELKENLEVYKLTGVYLVKSSQDSKLLRFTTSYQGVYLESYHLKLQRLPSGQFKVIHHDLPSFIVCSSLPNDLVVKDVSSAVQPLREKLAMYIQRREELKAAEAEFKDKMQVVESSAAADFVCLELNITHNVKLVVTLKYSDLAEPMPSSVVIVPFKQASRDQWEEELSDDMLSSVQSMFCDNNLCTAIDTTLDLLLPCFSNQVEQNQSMDEN